MDLDANQEPTDLAKALVEEFPNYLRKRLEAMAISETRGVTDAIKSATLDLSAALRALAAQTPQEQLKSPLELVREATLTLTEALEQAGVRSPDRDEWAWEVHPEDTFDLYPASSKDLGEQAWQLHLAWGIDKARLVAGMVPLGEQEVSSDRVANPAVALFGFDADTRSQLTTLVGERGYRSLIWRNPAALEKGVAARPVAAVVDLTHRNAQEAISRLSAAGIRVIAVQDTANDLTMAGILALGADDVMDLGKLVRRIDRVLPQLA